MKIPIIISVSSCCLLLKGFFLNGRVDNMDNLKAQREQKKYKGTKAAGIVQGNVSNASTIYGEEKFHATC